MQGSHEQVNLPLGLWQVPRSHWRVLQEEGQQAIVYEEHRVVGGCSGGGRPDGEGRGGEAEDPKGQPMIQT